jgi:hypothetical protein
MKATFVIQPQLTAIAVAYKNGKLIADEVLPRVPVGRQEFKYTKYNVEDSFTVPDTKVGRVGRPGKVVWGATETPSFTVDYGLDQDIPQADIDNAAGTPIDPKEKATEQVTDLVLLDREVRVANTVFATGSYAAANRVTLSGTSQWSDYTNSNPISAILTAMDGMIVRPNIMVIGRAVWTVLSQHPKVIAAAYPLGGNASVGGKVVSREALASLLELDEIIVGEGFVNTAAKGQTPALARVWGKHAALLTRNPNATTSQGVTFGVTAQWGERIAATIEDAHIGLRGGETVRVGESVRELVIANDAGYFFQNAVA